MPEPLREAYLKVAANENHLKIMFEKDRDRMLSFKDLNNDDLRSIRAATLVMAADHDVVTPEHAVAMMHLIPDARLVILPGTHGSIIGKVGTATGGRKSLEMTATLIIEFLDE